MTTAQIVKMSVTVNNSPIQDHNHEMTHGFKPFTDLKNFIVGSSTCQRYWNGEEGGALSLLSGQFSSIDGLLFFHSRSFKARSFSEHFIVRLLHCFSVKLNVKCAFLASEEYTQVMPLFLLVA